jgi:hypothetical protein
MIYINENDYFRNVYGFEPLVSREESEYSPPYMNDE